MRVDAQRGQHGPQGGLAEPGPRLVRAHRVGELGRRGEGKTHPLPLWEPAGPHGQQLPSGHGTYRDDVGIRGMMPGRQSG